MRLPQLRSSAGIAALRVERSVVSETSRSQENQISLRSDGDSVLPYSRTNGIWKLMNAPHSEQMCALGQNVGVVKAPADRLPILAATHGTVALPGRRLSRVRL
jgi:hypothetical protein